jgi:hypothetical protein
MDNRTRSYVLPTDTAVTVIGLGAIVVALFLHERAQDGPALQKTGSIATV